MNGPHDARVESDVSGGSHVRGYGGIGSSTVEAIGSLSTFSFDINIALQRSFYSFLLLRPHFFPSSLIRKSFVYRQLYEGCFMKNVASFGVWTFTKNQRPFRLYEAQEKSNLGTASRRWPSVPSYSIMKRKIALSVYIQQKT